MYAIHKQHYINIHYKCSDITEHEKQAGLLNLDYFFL